MMQYFLAGLAALFAIAAPLVPILLPLVVPLLPVAAAAWLLKPLATKIITAAFVILAVAFAYNFAVQHGWDLHKAKVAAANKAALSAADSAEQQMNICKGGGFRWDAGDRSCIRD